MKRDLLNKFSEEEKLILKKRAQKLAHKTETSDNKGKRIT